MKPTRNFKAIVFFLFLICLVFWARSTPAAVKPPKDFEKAIEGFRVFYLDQLKTHGTVGSTFMFLHDNKVLAQEFFGLANIEQNRKV
ncbi:MAG: hypothetical protein JXB23_17020, partial [Candidatus Aminicenantes bacterium]|nr:hypothetical protein [Candidatus Aminicenantes bacterium]